MTNQPARTQVNDADEVTIIDFPQMVSVAHPNGAELFARDVAGVGRFFRKKLGYMPEHDASLPRVAPDFEVRVPCNRLRRVLACGAAAPCGARPRGEHPLRASRGSVPGLWCGRSCRARASQRPCTPEAGTLLPLGWRLALLTPVSAALGCPRVASLLAAGDLGVH